MCSLKKGFMVLFFVLSIFALSVTVSASLPSGVIVSKIGTVNSTGGADYDPQSGIYSIRSTGGGVANNSDIGIHYVSQIMRGNGSVIVRFSGASSNCVASLMLRSNIYFDNSFARMAATNGQLSFTKRSHDGDVLIGNNSGSYNAPIWFKITKVGFDVNVYYSNNGSSWVYAGYAQMTGFTDNVRVGMAVNSTDGSMATASFDNFTVQSTPNLPTNYVSRTIGTVTSYGSSQYNFNTGEFTLKSSGLGIGNAAEDAGFHCAILPFSGNCSIIARVASLSNQANATSGIIIRANQSANASYLFMGRSTSGYIVSSDRRTAGSNWWSTSCLDSNPSAPIWLRIDRVGTSTRTYFSYDKLSWTSLWSEPISGFSGSTIYVGPAAYSGDSNTIITTILDNVEVKSISSL